MKSVSCTRIQALGDRSYEIAVSDENGNERLFRLQIVGVSEGVEVLQGKEFLVFIGNELRSSRGLMSVICNFDHARHFLVDDDGEVSGSTRG